MQEKQEISQTARAIVLVTGVAGTLAGFLLGWFLAIPLAEFHLRSYLDRVSAQDDATLNEAHNLLANLQQSTYTACSDSELEYFRSLLFRSDALRDAGRITQGQTDCSATAGHAARAIGQIRTANSEPSSPSGNPMPILDRSLNRTGLEQNGVFVLFGSHLPDVEGTLPIHLSIDPIADLTNNSPEAAKAFAQGMATDGVHREDDKIVGMHCSASMASCVTASVSFSEARRGEFNTIICTSSLGAIAGMLLGFYLRYLRRRSLSIERQLRRAIEQQQIHLVYQPIVNLANGKIVGAETLARWTKVDGTAVSPDVFIKVAEEKGFVGEITRFVLDRALKEFGDVLKKIPDFRLNVNIAPADLVDPEFLPMLDHAVHEAGIKPSSLVFEVTEGTTASREDAMESIRELRRRGHGIYIDDFGTGYSNLSYLLYLSVDTIKIDKAFVRSIGTESVTVGILPQIINMARSLNLGVVVEGIESEGQANYFSTNNIRIYGQGWLYGRPVEVEKFIQILGLGEGQSEIVVNPEIAGVPIGWRERISPAVAP